MKDQIQALEYSQMAVEKAPTIGDKVFSQGGLSWALCRSGEIIQGIELGGKIIPMLQAVGFIPGEICQTMYLGEGFILNDENEKANQTINRALELSKQYEMAYFTGWASRLLGEIALKTNPAQAAEPLAAPHFKESITIFQRIKAENELALAYTGYGMLKKNQKKNDQAREYLIKALDIFKRLDTPQEPDKVQEIIADLPSA